MTLWSWFLIFTGICGGVLLLALVLFCVAAMAVNLEARTAPSEADQ